MADVDKKDVRILLFKIIKKAVLLQLLRLH